MYYIHGTMGSGKTIELLKIRYNYLKVGKKVSVLAPEIDDREDGYVKSRALDEKVKPITIKEDDNLLNIIRTEVLKGTEIILIDEVNFLTKKQVRDARHAESQYDLVVMLFGIMKTASQKLFPGSEEAIIYSESVRALKDVCGKCGDNKSMFNSLFVNGLIEVDEAPIINVGDSEYTALCYSCYQDEVEFKEVVKKIELSESIPKNIGFIEKLKKHKDRIKKYFKTNKIEVIHADGLYVFVDEREASMFIEDEYCSYTDKTTII